MTRGYRAVAEALLQIVAVSLAAEEVGVFASAPERGLKTALNRSNLLSFVLSDGTIKMFVSLSARPCS